MNIEIPEIIPTHWHENQDGDKFISSEDCSPPPGFVYSRYLNVLSMQDVTFVQVKQEDVDKCKHTDTKILDQPSTNYMQRTCLNCGGEQGKAKWVYSPVWWPNGWWWPNLEKKWPKKWRAPNGHRLLMTGSTSIPPDLFLGLTKYYDVEKAMLVAGIACERCINALLFRLISFDEGYDIGSDEWHEAGTSCVFCEHMIDKSEEEVKDDSI